MVSRLLGALNRFKWLILGLVLAGAGVGAVLGRFVDPQYQVASTIILTGDVGPRGAPVQVDANMERQGWIDLARSFAIADTVVMRLALYIEPDRAGDSLVFRNFQLDRKAGRFVPASTASSSRGRATRCATRSASSPRRASSATPSAGGRASRGSRRAPRSAPIARSSSPCAPRARPPSRCSAG
jgi:uncharacterized protein involved in exopolysaccharide biosynthesis